MSTFRNVKERRNEVLKYIKSGAIVVIFDTETTGLNPKTDKIIQFSATKVKVNDDLSFTTIDSLNIYINPGRPLPIEYNSKGKVKFSIAELTGITDEQLKDKPDEVACFPKICEFMESADVWVAQNAKFDISMLRGTADRVRYCMEERPVLDILVMARDLIPKEDVPNYKLCSLAEYLFPEENISFHNAYNDVDATVKVLSRFVKQYYTMNLDESPKRTVRLERAGYFDSPYTYDRRIRLKLSEGDFGDIYYDITKQPRCWTHKKTAKAKRLFESIDMADIERQFMNKYGYKFGHNTIDEVADSWIEWHKEKKKEKKLKEA